MTISRFWLRLSKPKPRNTNEHDRFLRLAPFGIMEQGASGDLELWAESEDSESEGEEGGPGPP